MCQPTGKLKLCTCETENLPENNVWILHRYDPKKKEYIMGLAFPPHFDSDMLSYADAQQFILTSLNSGNCFDFPVKLKKKDVLTIDLDWKGKAEYFEYRYTGTKWEIKEWQPFDLDNHYKELLSGKIQTDKREFL